MQVPEPLAKILRTRYKVGKPGKAILIPECITLYRAELTYLEGLRDAGQSWIQPIIDAIETRGGVELFEEFSTFDRVSVKDYRCRKCGFITQDLNNSTHECTPTNPPREPGTYNS